jgi:hypothetical protein
MHRQEVRGPTVLPVSNASRMFTLFRTPLVVSRKNAKVNLPMLTLEEEIVYNEEPDRGRIG